MFTALDLVDLLRQEASMQASLAWGHMDPKAAAYRANSDMLNSLANRIDYLILERRQAEAIASAQLAARGGDMTPLIP